MVEQTDTTATVRVDSLRTESLARGCTDFSGTYSMVRSGDRWLISSADLSIAPAEREQGRDGAAGRLESHGATWR